MENDLYKAGIIFWCTQKKIEQGVPKVRPDANANANADAEANTEADANRSKTICRPPLKEVDIINSSQNILT